MTNAPDYFTIILRLFYDGAFVAEAPYLEDYDDQSDPVNFYPRGAAWSRATSFEDLSDLLGGVD